MLFLLEGEARYYNSLKLTILQNIPKVKMFF